MFSFCTRVKIDGVVGRQISDFLLHCTDEKYNRWWPGVHLAFHTLAGAPGQIGAVMLMDEYIGQHRMRARARLKYVVPGELIVWQFTLLLRTPVYLTIQLHDLDDGVVVTHTLDVGFRGKGRFLDVPLRWYFSSSFGASLDEHVRREFARLRDLLRNERRGARRNAQREFRRAA